MLGLNNVGALFFMLLSTILTLCDERKYFIAGLIITAIAIFTNGNAFILLPVLTAALLLQKKKRRALIFAGIIFVPVACYFATYESAELVGLNVIELIINYFCFIGNSFWVNPTLRWLPCFAGVIICFTWVYALWKQYYKENMACFAFLTFMLITGVAVVLNRADSNGMGDQRFRIYGSVHLVLTLMIWSELFDLKRWNKVIIPAIFCFSIVSTVFGTERIIKITENKRVSSYNWHYHRTGLTSLAYVISSDIVQDAEAAEIYTLPVIPLHKMQSAVTENAVWENKNSDINYAIDYLEEREGFVVLRGWAYTNNSSMNFSDNTALYLIDNVRRIEINPYWECRFDVSGEREKKYCGFFAAIPRNAVPAGEYLLGIEIQKRFIVPTGTVFSKLTDYKLAF